MSTLRVPGLLRDIPLQAWLCEDCRQAFEIRRPLLSDPEALVIREQEVAMVHFATCSRLGLVKGA